MRARLLLLSVAVVLIAVIAVSSMLSNVYAVSVASDEYVFDFKFGSSGSGNGQFNYPNGVAYDHNNNRIIVTDGTNKNVQVFDKDGNFLFSISESGFSPTAVAYDHNHDRILVAAWTLGGDKNIRI
jgi:DNA-binding beta-propeller fold protein YncE